MQVTETKADELSREFTIVIPASEIEEKFKQRLSKLAASANLPGFRPGKVPVGLIQKRYGESLRGEIIEETVNESSQAVITDKGLRPALPPRVEIKATEESSDLEYALVVEVLPEIEQPDFSAIALDRFVAEPDEAHVSATMERLANMVRGSQKVEEVRPATADDIVVADVISPADPKPFGDGKNVALALDDDTSLLPGLIEQLLGVMVGETRTVTITFPDDFHVPDLAGTTSAYEFSVKELQQREPLSIDDELAKRLGIESLEQLTKDIREHHEQELKSASRMRLKRALLDQLDKLYSFPLPKGLVDREYQTVLSRLKEEETSEAATPASGPEQASPEQAVADQESAEPTTEGEATTAEVGHGDEKSSEYYSLAERRVRLGLVLAEIGQRNNLRVAPEEIGKAIVAEAQRFPGQEKAVIEYFRNNADAREALAAPLLEEKVVDFILEMVTINDHPATIDELLRADDNDTTFEQEAGSSPETEDSPNTGGGGNQESNTSEVVG